MPAELHRRGAFAVRPRDDQVLHRVILTATEGADADHHRDGDLGRSFTDKAVGHREAGGSDAAVVFFGDGQCRRERNDAHYADAALRSIAMKSIRQSPSNSSRPMYSSSA